MLFFGSMAFFRSPWVWCACWAVSASISVIIEQVTAPVLWERGIRRLLAGGFTRFIELGPGTALTGFMKRIDRQAAVLNIGDVASLADTLRALGRSSA